MKPSGVSSTGNLPVSDLDLNLSPSVWAGFSFGFYVTGGAGTKTSVKLRFKSLAVTFTNWVEISLCYVK